MSNGSFRTSRPDHWVEPRPHRDPGMRLMTYGKLVPMDEEGTWLSRLLDVRPEVWAQFRRDAWQMLPIVGLFAAGLLAMVALGIAQ